MTVKRRGRRVTSKSRKYNRDYQSELRTREVLGDQVISRKATGELFERPVNSTKWTAQYLRDYKRDWMRRKRKLEKTWEQIQCCLAQHAITPSQYEISFWIGFAMGLQTFVEPK